MKRSDKSNITTIIHDLKNSYALAFKEKFPVNDAKMENVLNQTAKAVKKGMIANWYLEEGERKLKLSERRRRFYS
jgi:ribosomal protein S17E